MIATGVREILLAKMVVLDLEFHGFLEAMKLSYCLELPSIQSIVKQW